LFIATANNINDIQPALRDRLEIIQLTGYSVEEKMEIAKRHLVPRQQEAHGLKQTPLSFSNPVLQFLIQNYTRESGVRELDRQIAGLMRSVARRVASNEKVEKNISKEFIDQSLGFPKFSNEKYLKGLPAGVVVGLAWTYVGGDILFIETSKSPGKGNLTLTGNLGNVMKESASTALSYIKAHATELGIDASVFEETNIHIHVPEGAVPKDGPSAGITMMTALTSLLKSKPVKSNLAMTGEITLRGQVLPVGGIKEKVLAAKRFGIKTIIMCDQNRRDIEEINPEFIKGVQFIYVSEMKEVLEHALKK
jgi:ATP-dependent Lon protease